MEVIQMKIGIKVVAQLLDKDHLTTMYTEGNIKEKVYNKQEQFIKTLTHELNIRHMYPQSIEVFKMDYDDDTLCLNSEHSIREDKGSWYGVCDVTRRVAYEF